MRKGKKLAASAAIGAAVALWMPAGALAAAGTNDDCVANGTGIINPPAGGSINVLGGQVGGAGATLFVDFFLSPSSTNDYIDADGDGRFGFSTIFPFVDNLGPLYSVGGSSSPWWLFQYRSVGSVNGFNEFVENQTCSAIPISVPTEAGVFNQFRYANLGVLQWGGPFGNSSGTPAEGCEVEFSFLDVPHAWGVQVAGTPTWDAKPTVAGYGLNPIPSSTGFISNLQTLSRQCGTCAGSGDPCVQQDDPFRSNCAPGNCSVSVGTSCRVNATCPAGQCSITPNVCRLDTDCPAGQCTGSAASCRVDTDCPGVGETCTNPAPETCSNPAAQTCVNIEACNLAGPVVSLNSNFATPDEDTLFDFLAAWVPITPVASRGTGVENVRYSELQYLFVTGRFPNGENYTGVTRDVGSGTRNGEMNSLGIDTSWGRGDNLGGVATANATAQLGPNTQPTNCGGSGITELSVQSRRLAIGYTGLGGASRAVADAIAGIYEILNVCADVDKDGNPLCDCNPEACPGSLTKVCSKTTSIDCTGGAACPSGESCVFITPASPNNGYVRPTLGNVLDSCDACCGFQLGGNGSFVTRGDPSGGPFMPDNDAITDYINNIAASAAAFSGVQGSICAEPQFCSLTAQSCFVDADCPGVETCTRLKPCSVNGDCTVGVCEDELTRCQVNSPDCDGILGGTCIRKTCVSQVNMPGEFLARTFFLPTGVDCTQSAIDGMDFSPTSPFNQALQNDIRQNSNFGGVGQTPAFSSVNPTDGGRRPIRNNLSGGAKYSDGQTGNNYTQWNGAAFSDFLGTSNRLARRNKIQGDFNEDDRRTVADAEDLVDAYHAPRTWQRFDPQATGGGAVGSQAIDNAIPEILGDFQGDGNLTKEDLRYFADGLAMANFCSYGPNDGLPCVTDAGCPKGRCGRLDRKAGAIAVDTRIADWGRCDNDLTIPCLNNTPCGAGACDFSEDFFPWADPLTQLLVPPAALGVNPTFILPKDVNDVGAPFLATGAAYEAGDFRGDVAGGATPTAGAFPRGWDGFVDERDINYCCRSVRAGTWSDLDSAAFMDLSCDMNGDVEVDMADISELVGDILATVTGDVDLDGDVDSDDHAVIIASIGDPHPCNLDGSCGWENGDMDCDGFVTDADADIVPPLVPVANPTGRCAPAYSALCNTATQNCAGAAKVCSGSPLTACADNSGCVLPGQTCVDACAPWTMNRYVSMSVPTTSAGEDTALRVRLASVHHPVAPLPSGGVPSFAGLEVEGPNHYRYVNKVPGALNRCCNPASNPTTCHPSATCGADGDCPAGLNSHCQSNMCPDSAVFNTFFRCARLGCTAEYTDWAEAFEGGDFYVYGDAVITDSTYEVAHLASSCAGNEASCIAASSELTVRTARWGNVDGSGGGPAGPAAPDIGFVTAKVGSALGSFIEPRVQLREATPTPLTSAVNAQDIGRVVDAVQGKAYPFTTVVSCL